MSIILHTQYIAVYCSVVSTIGLSTQSKYASLTDQVFSGVITFIHNTHVDDTKHHLNTLTQY